MLRFLFRLYGTYEHLHTGFTTKALQDLTGGIVQSFSLSQQDKFLTYQVLNSAVPRSTLLIASISSVKSLFLSSGRTLYRQRLRQRLPCKWPLYVKQHPMILRLLFFCVAHRTKKASDRCGYEMD